MTKVILITEIVMHRDDEAPRHLRAKYPRFKTLGITGTQLSGGTISGYEQNTSLTGLSWVRAAEEMLRTKDYFKNGQLDKEGLVKFIKDVKKNTKLSDEDAAILAASKFVSSPH